LTQERNKESQGLRFFEKMVPPDVPACYNSPRRQKLIIALIRPGGCVGDQTVTLLNSTTADILRHHLYFSKNLRPVIKKGNSLQQTRKTRCIGKFSEADPFMLADISDYWCIKKVAHGSSLILRRF